MSFAFVSGLLHSILPSHWLMVGVLASLYQISFFRSIGLFFFTSLLHALLTLLAMMAFDWMMLHYLSHTKLFSFLVFIYMESLGFYYLISFYLRRKKQFFSKTHHDKLVLLAEGSGGRFSRAFFFPYFGAVVPMIFVPNWSWIVFPMGMGRSVFYDGDFLEMLSLYFLCMIFLMSVLMFLAYQGLSRVKQQWLDYNSRLILGLLFVMMGILNDVSHSILNDLKF